MYIPTLQEEMRRKEEELELSKEMENLDKWYALCINFVEVSSNSSPGFIMSGKLNVVEIIVGDQEYQTG